MRVLKCASGALGSGLAGCCESQRTGTDRPHLEAQCSMLYSLERLDEPVFSGSAGALPAGLPPVVTALVPHGWPMPLPPALTSMVWERDTGALPHSCLLLDKSLHAQHRGQQVTAHFMPSHRVTAIAVVPTLPLARAASTQGAAGTQGGNGEHATQVCHPSGPDVLESSTVAGVTHNALRVAGASHPAGSEPSRPTPLKSLHSSISNRYTPCQPYCRNKQSALQNVLYKLLQGIASTADVCYYLLLE
jgi:hypothetical protein